MLAVSISPPNARSALGQSIPANTAHAISVSLPTWSDNVGYERGEKRVVESMVSGYPRFFIHLSIQKLARICQQRYALANETCMLFPSKTIAEQCRAFILCRKLSSGEDISARLLHLSISPEDTPSREAIAGSLRSLSVTDECIDLHIVLFPEDASSVAKQFWQHAGMGISSRLAERCLARLGNEPSSRTGSPNIANVPPKAHNRHYSVNELPSLTTSPYVRVKSNTEDSSVDHSAYLEERYGRNLPLAAAASAKRALRRRVAGVLIREQFPDCPEEPCAGQEALQVGPSKRGVENVSEDDVYLYQTGMAAIWNAHNIALSVRPEAKSICFGFPYVDTLKILEKWGPGCYFFGNGLDSDIDEMEKILEAESKRYINTPPVLALFSEFPSNPLLRSSNLPRLRALADQYNFLIVIDETIGNFANVDVLPFADIVVSSLTKVFSGSSNVMGGSLVLNPQGRHYACLKEHMNTHFEDNYFNEDALFMERNSRDFRHRIQIIDANTEAICDFLYAKSVSSGYPASALKKVFYPKFTTREYYEQHRTKDKSGQFQGGFGGLFSLTFVSDAASHAFFDALRCYKGPSLGTNFTLASPFTILAHFLELEWAAQFGVEENLVRISIGLEKLDELLCYFQIALEAAEAVVAKSGRAGIEPISHH